MKGPCAANFHNAVTVSQQRLGKRVARVDPQRMRQICAALAFRSVTTRIDQQLRYCAFPALSRFAKIR